MPLCQFCNLNVELKYLKNHFKLVHQVYVQSQSSFKCCQPGCNRFFSVWGSYLAHLKTCNVSSAVLEVPLEDEPMLTDSSVDENDFLTGANETVVASCSHDSPESDSESIKSATQFNIETRSTIEHPPEKIKENSQECSVNELHKIVNTSSLLFVSTLSANPNLNRKCVQDVTEQTSQLLSSCLSTLRDKVLLSLLSGDVSSNIVEHIDSLFQITLGSFDGISTEHLRLKYLREHGFYIDPVSIAIDINEELLPGRVNPVVVKTTYVPIIELLRSFLSRPGVFSSIQAYLTSLNENSFTDFIQSPAWRKKVCGISNKIIWPLMLYFDDFQVNNVLGSHSDTGKIGCIQLSLPFLPPQLRSKLENRFVIQIFKSEDRVESGNKAMFGRLISDLNRLFHDGIEVPAAPNENISVYFLLGAFTGDNLGLNDMFGFVKSFSANYFCRSCTAIRDDSKSQLEKDPLLLRSVEDYAIALLLQEPSETGIREESAWISVEKFHPVEDESVDPMHDFFSNGVVNYDLGELLYYFIYVAELFTLETLNIKIAVFDYGIGKGKNIPPPIKENDLKSKWIIMSASETLTLVRFLSLIIGELVPEGNDRWDFYLTLRKIVDIVLAYEVTPAMSEELRVLVREHHSSFITLFSRQLPPKFHHIVHSPRLMSKLGPLHNFSCFRPESKNRDQKLTARRTTSRKNTGLTIAIKEQLKFAYKSLITNLTDPQSSSQSVQKATDVQSCEEMEINGLLYISGMCLAVDIDDNGYPIFGTIDSIVTDNNVHFFLISKFKTLCFMSHYHAFQVEQVPEGTPTVVSQKDLLSIFPVVLSSVGGNNLVTVTKMLV